jgi:hypothetical protein
VLKFRAIHFDYGTAASEQNFRSGLDSARLAGTGWPQEQQVPDRTPRRTQPGTKHLVKFDECFDGLVLPYDFFSQSLFKLAGGGTPFFRVQLFLVSLLRCCRHDILLSRDPLGTTLIRVDCETKPPGAHPQDGVGSRLYRSTLGGSLSLPRLTSLEDGEATFLGVGN